MRVELGVFAPRLRIQLRGLRVPREVVEQLQHAISRLRVRGLLTDREVDRIRAHLIKRIEGAIP